jgi:hypothetical protein
VNDLVGQVVAFVTSNGLKASPVTLLARDEQHVFYRGTDNNVHHAYWAPASGIKADQWTFDGSVGSDLATLLTG